MIWGSRDLGYLGSEINTPNIDRLAAQGVQFTDFQYRILPVLQRVRCC